MVAAAVAADHHAAHHPEEAGLQGARWAQPHPNHCCTGSGAMNDTSSRSQDSSNMFPKRCGSNPSALVAGTPTAAPPSHLQPRQQDVALNKALLVNQPPAALVLQVCAVWPGGGPCL